MSDFSWPSNIKPLTNKNYSTSRGSNLTNVPVVGGAARIAPDTTIEAPVFRLNFSLSNLQQQILMQFYDIRLNHGANSFNMELDAGNGIETMLCTIIPGTWSMSKPVNGVWYLALSVQAESTASQLLECTDLLDLYECYGDSLGLLLSSFENFSRRLPDVG